MAGKILVVGAGSPLGLHITDRLVARGCDVTGTHRAGSTRSPDRIAGCGATPAVLDLGDAKAVREAVADCAGAVFVPILTASAAAARFLRPDQQVVFFSSNNVAVDRVSPLYAALAAAEARVHAAVPHACILRPTMIYGHRADGNLSVLMRAARKWPLVPRPASSALQQPVFYRDLGDIAVQVLFDRDWDGGTVAVGGPDGVTYRQLYRAIARASGSVSLAVPVPVSWARIALSALHRAGFRGPATPEQLQRVNLDKRARGEHVITGETSLQDGLRQLASDLD